MGFILDGLETGVSIFYTLYSLAGSTIGIAAYVLRAWGLYAISKRRGINHPWMSWVPVLDLWVLGCISDQYQYVVKGKDKNKRKWLLGLSVATVVVSVVFAVFFGITVFNAVSNVTIGMNGEQLLKRLMGSAVGLLACIVPLIGIAIAQTILRYMSLYDLYTSCAPQNSALFLILSIFVTVTEPFFVFFNRNKDEGMPPRRQNQQLPDGEMI